MLNSYYPPEKKYFKNASFDAANRSFDGEIHCQTLHLMEKNEENLKDVQSFFLTDK